LSHKCCTHLCSVDIVNVSCGAEHGVAVGEGGKVFTWGCGTFGRLGHGSENDQLTASPIVIPDRAFVWTARCGIDSTILLTDSGTLLAMGSNRNNKLNLNQRRGFFSNVKSSNVSLSYRCTVIEYLFQTETSQALVPTAVRIFK
jgi:alpha-tubulin suppressor-like RCC1 family protein